MINNFKWGCLAIGIFQKYQLDHKFLCLLHTNKLPDICTARSRLRKSPRRVLQTNKHICSNKLTFVLIGISSRKNQKIPNWLNKLVGWNSFSKKGSQVVLWPKKMFTALLCNQISLLRSQNTIYINIYSYAYQGTKENDLYGIWLNEIFEFTFSWVTGLWTVWLIYTQMRGYVNCFAMCEFDGYMSAQQTLKT